MQTTISTFQRGFIAAGLVLMLAPGGCAGLPDYARPRDGVRLDDTEMLAEAVTYRR